MIEARQMPGRSTRVSGTADVFELIDDPTNLMAGVVTTTHKNWDLIAAALNLPSIFRRKSIILVSFRLRPALAPVLIL